MLCALADKPKLLVHWNKCRHHARARHSPPNNDPKGESWTRINFFLKKNSKGLLWISKHEASASQEAYGIKEKEHARSIETLPTIGRKEMQSCSHPRCCHAKAVSKEHGAILHQTCIKKKRIHLRHDSPFIPARLLPGFPIPEQKPYSQNFK